jgi:hypothetical protein
MIWEPHKDGVHSIDGQWKAQGFLYAHWRCGSCPGFSVLTRNTEPRYPHSHVEKIHEHVNSEEHKEQKELRRLAT